jgi:hypothetical protein
MTPYKLIEPKNNDSLYAIELTDGQFKGMIYEYGKVELQEIPGEDKVKLAFEYTNQTMTITNMEFNRVEFERVAGEILHHLIEEGLKNNSIVYSGGVDENRENDSVESDS